MHLYLDSLPFLLDWPGGSNEREKVGRHRLRISFVHRSPTQATMCVYCREHQCYKSVSLRRNPSREAVLEWLVWGHSGACTGKAAHLEAFEGMVLQEL